MLIERKSKIYKHTTVSAHLELNQVSHWWQNANKVKCRHSECHAHSWEIHSWIILLRVNHWRKPDEWTVDTSLFYLIKTSNSAAPRREKYSLFFDQHVVWESVRAAGGERENEGVVLTRSEAAARRWAPAFSSYWHREQAEGRGLGTAHLEVHVGRLREAFRWNW